MIHSHPFGRSCPANPRHKIKLPSIVSRLDNPMMVPIDPHDESVYTLIQHSLAPTRSSKQLYRSSFADSVRAQLKAARQPSKLVLTSRSSTAVLDAKVTHPSRGYSSKRLPPILASAKLHERDVSASRRNGTSDQGVMSTTGGLQPYSLLKKHGSSQPSLCPLVNKKIPPSTIHHRYEIERPCSSNPSRKLIHDKVAPAAEGIPRYNSGKKSAIDNTTVSFIDPHHPPPKHGNNSTNHHFAASLSQPDKIDNSVRAMSDQEKMGIIKGLKVNLSKAMAQYGKLPITHETPQRLQRKRALEQTIFELERDIEMISNGQHILIEQ
ncbi:hypothetical protein QVD99_006175 [Batrachochytrium dendrobatidis]|nr:hypothetical protein O5D80_003836 [Batrachochytrium dendrobatidis]KAK5666953.1 hypothetical protein QVD99_006175 [Batrachochytrium dendrobatidis]